LLRGGFTVIELMVVLGIITMLMGIAILAYQKLDKVARDNATRTQLQVCAALEGEFEALAPTNTIEGTPAVQTPWPTAGTILAPDLSLYQLGPVGPSSPMYETPYQFQENNSPFRDIPRDMTKSCGW
jgi:prepilin-type N-terminal cleavage/methylation domain-containing protein